MRPKMAITPLQQRILDCLVHIGAMSIQELRDELGASLEGTRVAMQGLHNSHKVYVKDWPYQGLQRTRQWAVRRTNSQTDAPKPPAMTKSESEKRHNAKVGALRNARRRITNNIFEGLMR